jgi:hypothetical protein
LGTIVHTCECETVAHMLLLLAPALSSQIEHVHMLYTPSGRSDGTPESPPVPVVITAAGELPAGTVLDDSNAPVFSGGGYPMWAEDQVCVEKQGRKQA